MGTLGRVAFLRPCTDADDAFLYDVFCTTWENQVAALPNPDLAQHLLRIQHIAQDSRFRSMHPVHERLVVLHEEEPAGRLYVHRDESTIHLIDLTLLPTFRSLGVGSQVLRHVLAEATELGQPITLRVARRNVRAMRLYTALGFRLVSMDDVDNYCEWIPPSDEPAQVLDTVSSHSVP